MKFNIIKAAVFKTAIYKRTVLKYCIFEIQVFHINVCTADLFKNNIRNIISVIILNVNIFNNIVTFLRLEIQNKTNGLFHNNLPFK